MSLSQQQSQKVSKAQPFTDNSSKNLYYQNQNPSKSYANLRLNHTNGQFPPHTVGNNSFIVSSKKQEVRERKVSENINSNEQLNKKIWSYNPSFILKINRVVRQDTKRTRCGIFDAETQVKLEHFLTFYCKQQDIKYKQGLNELAAPFFYLTKQENSNVTLAQSYNYFINFLDKFVPNFLQDSEFNSLQCFFFAFTLLMKYHDPNLNYFLQKNDISPEIYAYPWFITLFASKVELDILYNLWDLFLIENDQLLILYISLALMIRSKKSIISVDPSMLPQTISSLKIENLNDLKEIYSLYNIVKIGQKFNSLEIRKLTPISFSSRISQLNVLQKNYHKQPSTMLEMKQTACQIQKYVAMPISPIEILHHLYPSVIQCPNPDCEKNSFLDKIIYLNSCDQYIQQNNINGNQAQQNLFKTFHESGWNQVEKNKTEDIGIRMQNNRSKECKYCSLKVLIPNELNSYVNKNDFLREVVEISKQNSIKVYKDKLLDFKTFDLRSQSKNQGYLNKTTLVSMNKFDQETLDSLISDFIEYKNVSHFSFLISDYSTIDQDFAINPSLLYADGKQQEIYTVQKFSSDFIEYGFPYISIVEGGFKICHDIILTQGLKLNDHNGDVCKYCVKQNQNIQPRKQANSILDFFTNVFSSKDTTSVQNQTHNIHGITNNTNNLTQQQKRTNSVEKYPITSTTNYSTVQNQSINSNTAISSVSSSKKDSLIPNSESRLFGMNQSVSLFTQPNSNPSNTSQSNKSSFSQTNLKINNQPQIKEGIQNRTSSLHNNNNSQSNEKSYQSNIQSSLLSNKLKTKQDEEEVQENNETPLNNDLFSSAARNKTEKSRMNQVQASLSPQIKPKLMNKYQYQLRTPTTKFQNTFQLQDISKQYSGSDNKQEEFKQFQVSRDQNAKPSDLNERSLTIPNEDSFCDDNIDEININQIHNAQNYSLNSNQRSPSIQNEQYNRSPINHCDLNHRSPQSIIELNNRPSQYPHEQNINQFNLNHPHVQISNEQNFHSNPTILTENPRINDRNILTNEKGRETSNSKDKFSKATLTSLQQPLSYQQQQQTSMSYIQQSLADIESRKERKQHSQNGQSFPNQVFGVNSILGQNKAQNLSGNGGINGSNYGINVQQNSISSLKEDLLKSNTPQNTNETLKKSSTLNSHALKKIQNMGSAFQKQSKQNYFDIAKKQNSQNHFQLRGLFQTYKVSRECWNDFIQVLFNKPFSFYECQNLKDKNSEEVRLFQNTPNNYKSSSRILIISQEFALSISHNQQILNQLYKIKSGSKQIANQDKVIQQNFFYSFTILNLIQQQDNSSGKEDKNNYVSIKSFFFMRNLLKITSKKFNANILSFYFKIPDVFKSQKFETTQYFQFIENFDLLQLKELIQSNKLNEILHEIYQIITEDSEKFEIKSLYNMENVPQALDCIKKSKEYYTIQQNTNNSQK